MVWSGSAATSVSPCCSHSCAAMSHVPLEAYKCAALDVQLPSRQDDRARMLGLTRQYQSSRLTTGRELGLTSRIWPPAGSRGAAWFEGGPGLHSLRYHSDLHRLRCGPCRGLDPAGVSTGPATLVAVPPAWAFVESAASCCFPHLRL